MVNLQKKQELLEVWTNLKSKLSKLVYLDHHKGIIKEAVEIYLNQSSSFLSEYSDPAYQAMGATAEEKRVYQSQKVKNQKIVEECQELLSKLE